MAEKKELQYRLVVFDGEREYPLVVIKPEGAVAADYLYFILGVIEKLLGEKELLEREANASGKTIMSDFVESLGSAGLDRE